MDPELLELQEKFLAGNIESSVKVGKKSLFSQRNTTAKSPVPIVVPEKITTSDNLFDGVLTNVLEREDSNEVFKARPFQVGGIACLLILRIPKCLTSFITAYEGQNAKE